MRGEPEEILDEEHEQVLQRGCAVDVAKESGMVCTRLPGVGQRRISRVWQVQATTNAVSDLAAQLVDLGIEKVTLESTSDYWRIWYYLLETAGLDVQLVNARDVKNVPGARRRTSWTRCGWPSLPRRECCGPRLCRQRRSGFCVTTPGCGWT